MKKQFTSKSAFFNLRVLTSLLVGLSSIALVIVALSTLSKARAQQKLSQKDRDLIHEDPAARMAWERLRLQDEHGQIAPGALRRAYEQKKALLYQPEAWSEFLPKNSMGQPEAVQSIWTPIGPGNIGGRTRSIIIHPNDHKTIWLGSVGGGVWKTMDGGDSWSTSTDFLSNLAVDCMVMDPTNPDVLYAGTGETWYPHDGIQGDGIFKTTDGGSTWTQLSSTANNPDFYYVTRLAAWYSSRGTLYLLATTTTGIFRSIDGGTLWSRVMEGQWNTVVFRPYNGLYGYCLASRDGGDVFYSTNTGLTWTQSSFTGSPCYPPYICPITGRTELAYARSDPNGQIVYASAQTTIPAGPFPPGGSGALFKSTDGGLSFVYTGMKGTLYYSAPYMNTLWVDPTNWNTVVVGGVNLYRTTNGGASKQQIAQGTHSDHHVVVNDPTYGTAGNRTVFIGNDGGIYKTTDILGNSWSSLNHGLEITQFYAGAVSSDGSTIIGGAQDNGTLLYQGDRANWTQIACGDGGMCAVGGAVGARYFFGEIPTLQVFRSDSGSYVCPEQFGQYITGTAPNNLKDAACASYGDPCGNWAAPLLLDPNNPNTLLAGGISLWRTRNPYDLPSSVRWAQIKPPANPTPTPTATPNPDDKISAVAVLPGNSNIIWVGHNNGALYFTTNGTADNPSWTKVNAPALPQRYCARIAFSPRPPYYDRIYVAFGGYSAGNLWKSVDGGQTWTNTPSNGLPMAPITSIVTRWNLGYNLYVGTAVGVFASANDGATWSRGIAGDVPANVFVDDLFWTNNGSRLVAVTHGRGMFTADVQ